MTSSPLIAAMGSALVDHGADLSSDRSAILCLVAAGYQALDIGGGLDLAIAFAQRIYDARGTLELDAALRKVAAIMGDDHAA